MKFSKTLKHLAMALVLLVPGLVNAALVGPLLDIQKFGTDTGATFVSGVSFSIDATAATIITSGGVIDIPDQTFTLTSDTYNGIVSGKQSFSGTFVTGGGLLEGSFSNLLITDLVLSIAFEADLSYAGGSLATGLQNGRIEGVANSFSYVSKIGPVSTVPVPAAVWLFGSGLLGLIGVARRRA